MQQLNERLRNVPQIDEILNCTEITAFKQTFSNKRIKDTVRANADFIRNQIISGEITHTDRQSLTEKIIHMSVKQLKDESAEQNKRVINGTGIIIHTNLGRSPLSEKAALMVYNHSKRYTNLEYSTQEGKRKNRSHYVEKLLCDITGAEACIIVNNNAAAVYLALNSVCKDKEVIVSRGEIVEIGGSFRISDIVDASGCVVKEVGTTNKTYIKDVEKAIGPNTGLLLKMHTSNFKVVGFTADVDAKDLAKIGFKTGIAVMEDMGSGVLFDLREIGLKYERCVQDAVKDGIDIITFSGDKMLGGPQCGIIAGKADYLDKMRNNPLMRCFRVDKMCLIALEATISQYFNKTAIMDIPIYKQMAMPLDDVKGRAYTLKHILESSKIKVDVKPHNAQFGGGSLPYEYIESYALYITSSYITASAIEIFLRNTPVPVIGTIQNNEYILDIRTIDDEDFDYLDKIFSKMVIVG